MAAEFKLVAIADIIVPERLRSVDEDYALAIQASIVEHNLISPITVRRTPPATKPFKPYTLVDGAHRLRALDLNDEREVEAVIVEADKDEAVLVEVASNLMRNDLSVLDRAVFVLAYRQGWERKHGQIKRGGDQTAKVAVRSDSPIDQIAAEAARGFSVNAAERLGMSLRAIERASEIGKGIVPELRRALAGTPAADNQSLLLMLSKMEPKRQTAVVAAMARGRTLDEAIGDTDAHLAARERAPAATKHGSTVISNYGRLAEPARRDVLLKLFEQFPADLEWVLQQLRGGSDARED